MSERKFKDGDRIVVSQTPAESSDKQFAGMVGTVTSLSHKNGDRDVYRVVLDESDFDIAFYTEDLNLYGELDALREELAQAEAKVVSLKEAIKLKERDAKGLPIATVISYKDRFGPAGITKQTEDTWLNVFPTESGNPDTEVLDDREITLFLSHNTSAVIRKP